MLVFLLVLLVVVSVVVVVVYCCSLLAVVATMKTQTDVELTIVEEEDKSRQVVQTV